MSVAVKMAKLQVRGSYPLNCITIVYVRIQLEEDVAHLKARRMTDLSSELASGGEQDIAFALLHARGDEFHHGSPASDPRGFPKGPRAGDIVDPYLHLNAIKVKTWDFRSEGTAYGFTAIDIACTER